MIFKLRMKPEEEFLGADFVEHGIGNPALYMQPSPPKEEKVEEKVKQAEKLEDFPKSQRSSVVHLVDVNSTYGQSNEAFDKSFDRGVTPASTDEVEEAIVLEDGKSNQQFVQRKQGGYLIKRISLIAANRVAQD